MTRGEPIMAAIAGATVCSHISRISEGTPGNAKILRRRFAGARNFDIYPWRRARRIVNHAAAAREHRLHAILRRHRTFAPGKKAFDVGKRRRVKHQFNVRRGGDGVARQVIGRGAQSAGGNYQIGPFGRMTKHFDVRRQIVGHGRVVDRLHPQLAQARAKPLAVRIEPLPAGEFVADGDDFSVHAGKIDLC